MAELVLVVDDDPFLRELMLESLDMSGHDVATAATGAEAVALATRSRPALVLLDIDLPDASGFNVMQRLREIDPDQHVVMVTGHHDLDMVRRALRGGAYDYLLKPFELADLAATVSRALDHFHLLRLNQEYRRHLEQRVREQTEAIRETRDIALLTLAKLAESRDNETGLHLERIAAYSQRLAEELHVGPHSGQINDDFLTTLLRSSPLHDIGKVGIPDAVLLKNGPLSPDEWVVMRRHTTIGGDTLRQVCDLYAGHHFLTMGMQIAYSHHERWNGTGYPQGLVGDAIPLPARIVAVADVYDAITSVRPYKPALSHDEAVHRIERNRGIHFDPAVLDAFLVCHGDLASLHDRMQDTGAPT